MATVGIIGVNGRFGRWFEDFFKARGDTVIGSDLETKVTNIDVMEKAEVVLFCVPISKMKEVIGECQPFSRDGQLCMDITSVKLMPTEAFRDYRSQVVSLHPMCSPTTQTLRGQTLCVDVLSLNKHRDWLDRLFADLSVVVKETTADDHDRHMAVVQGLPHASVLAMARVMREYGIDVAESKGYTSPFYLIAMSLMGRILNQDPNLYFDIQVENPYVVDYLRKLIRILNEAVETIETKDRGRFVEEFLKSKRHFGDETEAASLLFNALIRLRADLSGPHVLKLSFEGDKPGVLNQITQILAKDKINMTSIHSWKSGDHFGFEIGFEVPIEAPQVRKVVKEILKVPSAKIV
ncbi:MAG: prephenate dehydrogenase/arogenate dehydrogenase family protein [Candidatus Pacebacteria bacterium]|nr:prephenate dehydrogenase/arogenate dehydrogenase family protein [Candidatus Paceibacterota bacterium]